MDKGGRPKKEFDQKTFESLCHIQCTREEICSFFDNCDHKTLSRWCQDTYGEGFSPAYKRLSDGGKSSLRRMQWKSADAGNVTMQIFLGKQMLGQKDKSEVSGEGGGPITLKVVYDDGKPQGDNNPPAEATS